jgi:hypothetical protein
MVCIFYWLEFYRTWHLGAIEPVARDVPMTNPDVKRLAEKIVDEIIGDGDAGANMEWFRENYAPQIAYVTALLREAMETVKTEYYNLTGEEIKKIQATAYRRAAEFFRKCDTQEFGATADMEAIAAAIEKLREDK